MCTLRSAEKTSVFTAQSPQFNFGFPIILRITSAWIHSTSIPLSRSICSQPQFQSIYKICCYFLLFSMPINCRRYIIFLLANTKLEPLLSLKMLPSNIHGVAPGPKYRKRPGKMLVVVKNQIVGRFHNFEDFWKPEELCNLNNQHALERQKSALFTLGKEHLSSCSVHYKIYSV